MKKIIACSLLCVLLSSCTGQSISDKNKVKTLPASDTVGVNEIGFQTDTPSKSDADEDNNTNLHENTPIQSQNNIPSDKDEDKTLPTSDTNKVNEIGFQTGAPSKSGASEDNNANIQENIPMQSDKIEEEKAKEQTDNPSETVEVEFGEPVIVDIDDNIIDDMLKHIDRTKYNKYLDFLNVDGEVIDCVMDDIDLDGNGEIVITIDVKNENIKIYVLRETNGQLQEIGLIEGWGYGIYKSQLVQMKGGKQKYINAFLSNGASLTGFALYKVYQDKIELVEYSASATGAGSDYLVSSDNNGIYDGYVQHRYSYDVMYFYVTRYYKWNGESFDYVSSRVDIPEYPEDEERVIRQFLKLNMLPKEDRDCDEVQKRLNEINKSGKLLDFQKIKQFDNIYEWIVDLQNDLLKLGIQRSGNYSIVTVPVLNTNIVFVVSKTEGRFCITDIKGEFAAN